SHVRDGAERRIRKSRYCEQRRDHIEIRAEDSRDQQRDAETSKNRQCLSSCAKSPALLNQVSRYNTSKEISEIGSDEGHPHSDKTAPELDAFRDQEYREPIGHKKPDRIGGSL